MKLRSSNPIKKAPNNKVNGLVYMLQGVKTRKMPHENYHYQTIKFLSSMKRNNLNCIDLFAGAGGFSLAENNVRLTVSEAIEMNSHACALHIKKISLKKGAALYKKHSEC